MRQRDIARRLAAFREQLEELGDDHPERQRSIDGLYRSLEHLRTDLRILREGPQAVADAEDEDEE